MIVNPTPHYQALYRARSAVPSVVLIRKRCACGRTVVAKQLVQYGKCMACVRAE